MTEKEVVEKLQYFKESIKELVSIIKSNQALLLENQVRNLEKVDSIWLHTDSIRRKQITQYEQVIQQQEKTLKKTKKLSRFKDFIIGGLSILSLCLLL